MGGPCPQRAHAEPAPTGGGCHGEGGTQDAGAPQRTEEAAECGAPMGCGVPVLWGVSAVWEMCTNVAWRGPQCMKVPTEHVASTVHEILKVFGIIVLRGVAMIHWMVAGGVRYS